MSHTADTPTHSDHADRPEDESLVDAHLGDEHDSEGITSFVFLTVALLVLVGASVFFVGTLLDNEAETAAAEADATAVVEQFESESAATVAPVETTPATLPLVDDGTEDPLVDDGTEDTAASPESTEIEEGFDETEAPFPNVNPNDIAIAFVNRIPGEEYGTVGYIDREGNRQSTELDCDRIDLNANGGLCLDDSSGLGGAGRGLILDANLNPNLRFGINLPSRAAASPDGEIVAWTGFSLGHDYLSPGEFATTTQLIEVDRGIGANLETQFTTFGLDNQVVDDATRNFWGVTFVDSETFYATIGIGEETSIVQGTISNSRLQVIHENATCPEVSPDGSTIVAKERRGDFFQVILIDTETGERRDLPENRSVEDQVEFLDNDTIIYGLPNESEGTESQPAWDVWSLDLNGGTPQLLIPFADSPAAI